MTEPAGLAGLAGPGEQDGAVLVERVGRAGHLRLNRPRVINALSSEMVDRLTGCLTDWACDDGVDTIVLTGSGDRGLCSGGDVRAVRDAVLVGDHATAQRYWRDEYRLNAMIADSPTPVIAVMDGIVMGGGLGLAAHAATRLVTERTRVGMPETMIGFFPDVGLSYPLSRAPGETGTHLVMTGSVVDGADAIALGLADAMISSADRGRVLDHAAGHGAAPHRITPPPSTLVDARGWIDVCYVGDDPVAILDRLRRHPDPAAQQAAVDITARSPWSVAVALAAIRRAAALGSLAEVLEQDRLLSERFAPYTDLVEGVRAQLVDRDRSPRWRHASLDEVDPAEVGALFA